MTLENSTRETLRIFNEKVSKKPCSSLGPPDDSIARLCDVSPVRLMVNCGSRRDLCCATKLVVVHQRSHGKYIGTILVSGKVHSGTQFTALQGTQRH